MIGSREVSQDVRLINRPMSKVQVCLGVSTLRTNCTQKGNVESCKALTKSLLHPTALLQPLFHYTELWHLQVDFIRFFAPQLNFGV